MNNYQIEGEQRNTTTHIALFTINAMQYIHYISLSYLLYIFIKRQNINYTTNPLIHVLLLTK